MLQKSAEPGNKNKVSTKIVKKGRACWPELRRMELAPIAATENAMEMVRG
jgi:hypothetical protein